MCQSDFLCPVWFCSSKEGPDPIQMALSGFGQMDLVQKRASMQESSGSVLAKHNWPTTSFPTFRLGWVLTQTAWVILCKTSLDLIGFWLTVSGFGQTEPLSRFPGSVQVLTSTYKLNLPSKALQVLIFASWSLQV